MVRLSKLTDYAVVVLIRLGQQDQVQTTPGLARATGLAIPTVAKVMKSLGTANLVRSTRGSRGGYLLARPLAAISLADVVAAIEGPIALAACGQGQPGRCEVESVCAVRGRWSVADEAIRSAFSTIMLADLDRDAGRDVPPAPGRTTPASAVAEQGTVR